MSSMQSLSAYMLIRLLFCSLNMNLAGMNLLTNSQCVFWHMHTNFAAYTLSMHLLYAAHLIGALGDLLQILRDFAVSCILVTQQMFWLFQGAKLTTCNFSTRVKIRFSGTCWKRVSCHKPYEFIMFPAWIAINLEWKKILLFCNVCRRNLNLVFFNSFNL